MKWCAILGRWKVCRLIGWKGVQIVEMEEKGRLCVARGGLTNLSVDGWRGRGLIE